MKLTLRKLGLLVGAVGALGIGGLAVAQIVSPTLVSTMYPGDLIKDIPEGVAASTNVYASILQVRSMVLGQNSQHLTAPTLTTTGSGCGGSAASVNGTDTSGQIAQGSTASTSCVVTFAKAYATAPECFVSINNVADSALKCSTTTTAMTITQTSAASNVTNYLVVGLAGG